MVTLDHQHDVLGANQAQHEANQTWPQYARKVGFLSRRRRGVKTFSYIEIILFLSVPRQFSPVKGRTEASWPQVCELRNPTEAKTFEIDTPKFLSIAADNGTIFFTRLHDRCWVGVEFLDRY